jgi:hypothetical protein
MTGPRPPRPIAIALVLALVLSLMLAPISGSSSAGVSTDEMVTSGAADPVALTGMDTYERAVPTAAPGALREPVRSERNTTAYLELAADVETRRFGTAAIDVGGAIAADSGATHSTYELTWLRSSFRAAGSNETARRLAVDRAADRIDDRIRTLERRERRAITQYNNGKITPRSYLRELAAIDRSAESLRETVSLLHTYNSAVGQSISSRRIANMKARLLPLEGPVRAQVASSLRDRNSSTRVYIETSNRGIVLATIDRDSLSNRYLREAHVPSARQPGSADSFGLSQDPIRAVQSRFREVYLWGWNNTKFQSIGQYRGEPSLTQVGVYPVQIDHPHGTNRAYDLVAIFDGATRDVFREIQYKDLSAVPTVAAGTNTSGGINLTVNRTRTGGPMRVTVTETMTGDPVQAAVFVDGEQVGRTGVDGRYWAIAPRPAVRITVLSEGTDVSTTVLSDGVQTG